MVRGSVVTSAVVAGAVVVVLTLVPAPSAAAAPDYVGTTPPVVQGIELSRPGDPPAARAQEADPEDRIPITGGDVAGLTFMGLGSLVAGIALTRRARRSD